MNLLSRKVLPLLVTTRLPGAVSFGSQSCKYFLEGNMAPLRRSSRIRALSGQGSGSKSSNDKDLVSLPYMKEAPVKKRKRRTPKPKTAATKKPSAASSRLPRTRENAIKSKSPHVQYVLGIDEAGRGPLAGPVVAAAIWAPQDVDGIVDSKAVTKESDREDLYEKLVALPKLQWAVSVVDAARIDEINILQATLEGMRQATMALVNPLELSFRIAPQASVDEAGCYVVTSSSVENSNDSIDNHDLHPYYALIDGNKVPADMPCPAESMVKGDSKEFCIAAASILAKVTRDRLMQGYHQLYPEFQLEKHKGYPTAAHMKTVHQLGATPIHRRTFAPLKHMEFDKDGNILRDNRK